MKVCKSGLHTFEGKRCSKCSRLWEANNRERIGSQRETNPNTKISKREWAKRNSDKVAMWKTENPEGVKQCIKIWRKNNRECSNKIGRHSRQRNLPSQLFYNSSRRASKLKATPKWLSKEHRENMKGLYRQAKYLESKDGVKRHVDYILPIKSDMMCGLHVPWNLQILTASEDCSKQNSLL